MGRQGYEVDIILTLDVVGGSVYRHHDQVCATGCVLFVAGDYVVNVTWLDATRGDVLDPSPSLA